MPPFSEVRTESLQSYVGGRVQELEKEMQSQRRDISVFGTPIGENSGNMDATGLGDNRGEGVPRITTPSAQSERLRTQPHLSTTGISASPIDTRAAPLGKAGMTVGFTQPRVEPDVNVVYFDREAQQRHRTSTPINQRRSPAMAYRTVVPALSRFEGKHPRQWLRFCVIMIR